MDLCGLLCTPLLPKRIAIGAQGSAPKLKAQRPSSTTSPPPSLQSRHIKHEGLFAEVEGDWGEGPAVASHYHQQQQAEQQQEQQGGRGRQQQQRRRTREEEEQQLAQLAAAVPPTQLMGIPDTEVVSMPDTELQEDGEGGPAPGGPGSGGSSGAQVPGRGRYGPAQPPHPSLAGEMVGG